MDFFAKATAVLGGANPTNSNRQALLQDSDRQAPAYQPLSSGANRASTSSSRAVYQAAGTSNPKPAAPSNPIKVPNTIKLPHGDYPTDVFKSVNMYFHLKAGTKDFQSLAVLSSIGQKNVDDQSTKSYINILQEHFTETCTKVQTLLDEIKNLGNAGLLAKSDQEILALKNRFQNLLLDLSLSSLDKNTENNTKTYSIGEMIRDAYRALSELASNQYHISQKNQKQDSESDKLNVSGGSALLGGLSLVLTAPVAIILPPVGLPALIGSLSLLGGGMIGAVAVHNGYNKSCDEAAKAESQQLKNHEAASTTLYGLLIEHLKGNFDDNKDLLENLKFLQAKFMPTKEALEALKKSKEDAELAAKLAADNAAKAAKLGIA